jgi:hypothetical protein
MPRHSQLQGSKIDHEQIDAASENLAPPDGVNAFAVNFLWMVLGLWAKDFPEDSVQGVTRVEALAMAAEVTGRSYDADDLPRAFADLTELRNMLRSRRVRQIGTSQ